MSLPHEASKLGEFFDDLLTKQQARMLAGKLEGATPEQTAANYRAAVDLNLAMTRLRKAMDDIWKGEDPDADTVLLPMENPKDVQTQ